MLSDDFKSLINYLMHIHHQNHSETFHRLQSQSEKHPILQKEHQQEEDMAGIFPRHQSLQQRPKCQFWRP